jgi:hypothetical protein
MAEFFDFDPVTGVREEWAYDEMTGDVVFHRAHDVEPLLKAMHETRMTGRADKNWKRDMPTLYAEVDAVTQVELLKKGIDVHKLGQDPTMFKRFCKEIETNYPHLKASDTRKGWRPQ